MSAKKDRSVIQHKCDVQRPFPRLLASFLDPTKYVYLWKGFESPTSKSGSHSQTPRWPLNFSSDSNYWITFQYIPLIMFNWEGKYIDVYKLYIWIKVYQPPQRKLINDVAFLDIYMYEWGLYQILWNLQSLYISVLNLHIEYVRHVHSVYSTDYWTTAILSAQISQINMLAYIYSTLLSKDCLLFIFMRVPTSTKFRFVQGST